jgi:hypothetical protein
VLHPGFLPEAKRARVKREKKFNTAAEIFEDSDGHHLEITGRL